MAAAPASLPTTPAKDDDALRKSAAEEEERALARALGTSSESISAAAAASPVAAAGPSITPEQLEIDGRSVYVGNVDYSTTPQELQLLFASCGAVQRITIPVDRYTSSPKGFAYIEFASSDAVDKAVAMTLTWKNRQLKIVAKRSNVPGLSQHTPRTPPFRGGRRPWRGAPRRAPRGYHPYE